MTTRPTFGVDDRDRTDPADEPIDHAAWQGAVEQTFEIDTRALDRYLMYANMEVVFEDEESGVMLPRVNDEEED